MYHLNERNIVCEVCGFKTVNKPKMTRHMKSVSEYLFKIQLDSPLFLTMKKLSYSTLEKEIMNARFAENGFSTVTMSRLISNTSTITRSAQQLMRKSSSVQSAGRFEHQNYKFLTSDYIVPYHFRNFKRYGK